MSNQHDHEGRQDLDAVSRAYRDARDGDGMTPPAALDDAIRAAAHRAVHSGPKLAGSSWIRRWTPQLAVAAVVVLSVSVVFVSIEERPELAPASIQKIALNQSAAPPAEAALPLQTKIVEAAPAAALDAVKKKATTETGATAADAQFARQKDATLLKEERSAASVAAPPPAQLAAAAPVHAPPVHAPPASPAAAGPPAPASVVANVAPSPFPAAAGAIAPARREARADAPLAAAPEPKPVGEKLSLADAARSREAGGALAKPAAANAAPAPTVIAPAAQGTVAQAPMMKQLAPNAATTAAAAAPARAQVFDAARSNAQASESVGVRGFSKEDKLSEKFAEDERPGPWLKRLLELREQNKLKELREQLARFRKAHPDVVLPKVLTELPAE